MEKDDFKYLIARLDDLSLERPDLVRNVLEGDSVKAND
jgi:hypothetical protein